MYDLERLFALSHELESILISKKIDELNYTSDIQKKSNILLDQYATLSGVYESSKAREKKNIEQSLTVIDRITHRRKQLVDIDSMFSRVDSVLYSNDLHSCLKSLAIANKCAHAFDGLMNEFKTYFKDAYYLYSGNEISDITFADRLEDAFPDIDKVNKQYIYAIRNYMKINYQYMDTDTFIHLYNSLSNKNEVLKAYLKVIYNLGKSFLELQNNMFAIKNKYTYMIGQMLKDGTYNDVFYELVETEEIKQGFSHMLVIDDPSLSYYIEVHLHDKLKEDFVSKFDYTVSSERTTLALGASAIYERVKEEAKEIKRELNRGNIKPDTRRKKHTTRAKIISRNLDSSNINNHNNESIYAEATIPYEIKTKPLVTGPITTFEEFLKENNIERFNDTISYTSKLIFNETIDSDVSHHIAYNYHYNLFLSLDDYEKDAYIKYALYDRKYTTDYEKMFVGGLKYLYETDRIYKNLVPKLLIYKDEIIEKFKRTSKQYKGNFAEYFDEVVDYELRHVKENGYGRTI